jgi:hypothetical protein
MNDKELMQQALDALEAASRIMDADAQQKQDDAIAALRERLAQPEQEPTCDCPDDKCYGWTGLCKRVAQPDHVLVLVPVEPTEDELTAMQLELPEHQDTAGARVLVKAMRRAMLAARPGAKT